MKENNVEKYLKQHLSGDPPREAFKQQTLRDSTAALVRVQRRRSALRRAECAAAAVLIAAVGFLGGRLSMPHTLPSSVDVMPQATAEPDGITVPSDLVAWLDAARLFKRLGMEDRMGRAVEHAGKLLPSDAMTANNVMEQTLSATGDDVVEDQNRHLNLAGILDPQESVESVSGIMAQIFGGYNHASWKD